MLSVRRRTVFAAGALIILAGVGVPVVTALPAAAAVSQAVAATTTVPAGGIDVSQYTPVSSWTQVQQAGYRFAGIEATQGNYYADPSYVSDVQGATAAGLYVTPYVFADPYGSQESNPPNGTAAQQADYAIAEIKKADPSGHYMLPLTLDLETNPYASQETNSNACYGLSPAQMVDWIKSFISEEQVDLKALSPAPIPATAPIIYTTPNWWDACTGDSTAFGSNPLWVADYGVSAPSLPSGWDNFTFWQYSNTGTVSGVSGDVDQDVLGPDLLTSAVNESVGTVRISTLTSLQGDGDTFTSSSLPAGLSISSTGQITGTPTEVGRYSVTVTPSSGAAPSSVPFTWDVHGPITVTAADQSATVGSSVAYQVSSSGPDQAAGFRPSFTASGLPPGLSMSFSGLVTGWPTAAGTYHVTVTAADSIDGSGSTPFTWTVTDSTTAEVSGAIRLDLGGKCLDHGTGVRIWNCNGTVSQDWTLAQDGTIRALGECLTESGTAFKSQVVLAKCTGAASQRWQAQDEAATTGDGWTGPAFVNGASGHCLGDPGGDTNGVYVEVLACNVGASKTWLTGGGPVESGIPGMCLADPANATANGTRLVLWHCYGWHEEQFTFAANGTVQIHGKCVYVNPSDTGNGAAVVLEACGSGNKGEAWAFHGASPFGGTLYNPWNRNSLGVDASTGGNGTAVGTYGGSGLTGLTWRPI